MSWTYWALNGEDPYGLLNKQYGPAPARLAKQQLPQTTQSPFTP